MQDTKTASRAWTREQTRRGRIAARPVIACGLAGSACAAAQAWCIARIAGAALAGAATLQPAVLGLFVALAICRAWLLYVADGAAFEAGAAGRQALRRDVLQRMVQAGPALLRTHHTGTLAATATDHIEALEGLYARWVPAATLALTAPALILLATFATDPYAALVLLLAGSLVPVGQAASGIGAAAASRGQFVAMARLQARFLDRVRGIATIVLSGRAESEAKALALAADELRQRTMRVLRVAFLSSAFLDLAMASALVVLALHYRAALSGTAAPPVRPLLALLLVPEFFAPLRAFSAAYQDRIHASGAADALLDVPTATIEDASAPVRTIEARGLALSFENVSVTWDPARGPALDGLSFYVAPGEMLVLAGPSGAGKSTVIELLLGFVRPDSGRILINGHDIADIVPEALSALSAWIGQRPTLFAASIRENIAFARADATSAEIEDAARMARVSDYADMLPRGLDTLIGEGGYGLSGGQAQRIAIARAFLKGAKLLLLDEPTAHLDPATEADVLASLRRLAMGRTVVMASHSAAAHAFAGRRLDLREGRLAAARGVA